MAQENGSGDPEALAGLRLGMPLTEVRAAMPALKVGEASPMDSHFAGARARCPAVRGCA
jgi:hypothetical protein